VTAIDRGLDATLRATIEPPLRRLREPLAEHAPSEWSFNNLLWFRRTRGWRYADHPIPHLRGRGYDDSLQLITLCAVEDLDRELLRGLQGEQAWFCPLPEGSLARFDPAVFVWRAERNDADYLYAADSFRHYAGVGLGAKRLAVERLRARHRLHSLTLDASLVPLAKLVLEGWCRDKQIGLDDADARECLEALTMLEPPATAATPFGYLHLADDAPAGFVVCEALNPGVIVVRFSKGLRRYDGIFPLMYQHLVRQTDRPVQWLNFEQDLGRANFRRSKLSFQPAHLLPKYRLRVR